MIIDAYWKRYGFAPSIENIMNMTGNKSKANVHRIVVKLCELGHCKRIPNTARSVRPSYLRVKNLELE
jgi:SOS-response transcriptional repressor LexA